MKITPDVFAAFLKCPTKCWLRTTGEPSAGNTYPEWVKAQNDSYRKTETERLVTASPKDKVALSPAMEDVKAAKWRLASSVAVQAQMDSCALESELHAVERVPAAGRGKSAQFIPIRFVFTNTLSKDDKLLLAFDAFAFSKLLGREISIGKIIHGDDHSTLKVKTSALAGEVRKRIEKLAALLSSPSPPDLVLNRHCAECEFQSRCRQKAVEKDDLSLLSNMPAKERKKLHSKGIFTVTQLSCTFRARRRCKRWRSQQPDYSHALKALAIREKKVHVIGRPKIELVGTPVYLDVEGTDDGFYYLIGCRTNAQHRSFWAEDKSHERTAFERFLEFLAGVPNPKLIFYGRYERRFLSAMLQRYADLFERFPSAKNLSQESLNLISVVYSNIYFPTYGNTLKDLAKHLGFAWTTVGASGLQTLAWRAEWESTKEDQLMETLLRYNAEDCAALELVTEFVTKLCQEDGCLPPTPACLRVEEMKTAGHFLINKGGGALPEFKAINQAAYWDYQRTRVYVRTSKVIKKASRARKIKITPPRASATVLHSPPTRCPSCGDTNLVLRCRGFHSVVRDIKFLPHGAKAWVTYHISQPLYCSRCQRSVGSPLDHPFSLCKYGPKLRAYSVDQLVRLNIPGATIARSLGNLFKYDLRGEHLSRFKADFAEIYPDMVKELTEKIAKGPLVHVDETAARVVGKSAVVWVLASMEEVVFLYADNREGEMVHELLSKFRGVLVSDFYAVYDAFDCPQQKCLIHLIRDLNDDLHRHPFDSELRKIASEFTGVLKPIVETIDQRGLKSRFLAKHQPSVRRFMTWVTSQDFESEVAQKYAQRFRKNREKLFTFMSYNGVPWNNNNAENAIRAFASVRERVGGLCTEKSLRHYLILLSISETCKRRGLSFFDFLCSGKTSFEGYAARRAVQPRTRRSKREPAGAQENKQEDKRDQGATQRSEKVPPQNQAMPLMPVELPSPWDRFRSPGPTESTSIINRSLKLERFDDAPFGGVVLAIPALMESGVWEQSSHLFPAWIDRRFAEHALLLVASMVLCRPVNGEAVNRPWPTGWNELLCRSRLPDSRSLVDLVNLIARSPMEVAKWQGALADKWICDTSRVKAVLMIGGHQRVLLESPAVSSLDEQARNSLLAHGMVELWFRVFDGAPMLLLNQTPIENIKPVWKEWILPQIQNLLSGHVSKLGRNTAGESPRLTVVFSKGGVDLRLFRILQRDGLHVLSYRLSGDGLWPDGKFAEHEVEVQPGHRESVRTAERALETGDNLRLREMLCVCRNGRQFTVLSSDRELDLHRIAAKIAFEFTASRFLDRLQQSLAEVRSHYSQQVAGVTPEFKVGTWLEGFLGNMVLIGLRVEAIMEQILREKLPRPIRTPLALRDLLSERVDLVPTPGVNILKIFVHLRGDVGEQCAVAHLCSRLTATETRFPGTNLRLVYQPVLNQQK